MTNEIDPSWNGRINIPDSLDLDPTLMDVRKKIDPNVYDMVVEEAKRLQTEHDEPFEKGDYVFYPTQGNVWQVLAVYDNRHRAAIRTIDLDCRHAKERRVLNVGSVLQLGYLMQAHLPHNPNILYILAGDTIEGAFKPLAQALRHIGTQSK